MRTETTRNPSGSALRIGLIGCGEVCEHKHMPALRRLTGVQVTAVADCNAERARHVAARYRIPNIFPDARSLIRAGAADVIGVLVPPGAHMDVAIMAMEAGCHVLVEKPVALSLDDADALVEAARNRTVGAFMGFHMRWHRLMRRARDGVRNADPGAIESIRTVWNSPRGDQGIPLWKCSRVTGGGCIVELAVHLFDLWRYVLGTEVEEVFVRARHGVRDDENVSVSAVLANGALASAQLSERTGHEIELEVCGDQGRLRVSGIRFDGFERYQRRETAGMIRPRVRGLMHFARELPTGVAGMRRLGDYGDSYQQMWAHVVDAARSGIKPVCSLEDGREALRVVLAAAASASRGEPVRVADAPRSLAAVTRS